MTAKLRLCAVATLAAIVATGLAWSLSSPSAASPAEVALSTCQAKAAAVLGKVGGEVRAISGAFAAPAAVVANWQERRGPPDGPRVVSDLRRLPATNVLTVCYFDGVFHAPGSPPGGKEFPPYDRLIAIVDASGNLVLDTATWQNRFPVVDPSKF
jgi:hypothetical protein